MSWADGVLILLLAAFTANGVMIGFIRQLAGIAGLLLGLVLAMVLHRPLALVLIHETSWCITPEATAFLLIFLGVWIVVNLAAFIYRPKPAHDCDADRDDVDWADALSGGAFGFVSGIAMLSMLVAGILWLDLSVGEALETSHVGRWLSSVALGLGQRLFPWLPLPWGG